LGKGAADKRDDRNGEVVVIAKKDLVYGYYKGKCRNARIAYWDEKTQRFYHLRAKFGKIFCETIQHPEDEEHYDVFVPEELLMEGGL